MFHRYNDINIVSNCGTSCCYNKKKKNKFDFKKYKNNTICSLNEIEHFLCNFNSFKRYIKLYNFFK